MRKAAEMFGPLGSARQNACSSERKNSPVARS